MIKKNIIVAVLLLFTSSLSAQIRIDKQQCFGGFGSDLSYSITQCDDGYIIIGLLGESSLGTGLVQCDQGRTWVVKTNNNFAVVDAWCYPLDNENPRVFRDRNASDEFYLVGDGMCYGANNLKTIKIDSNGNELWSCCFGNEFGHQYRGGRLYTLDGGIINSGLYTSAGGDVGQVYFGYDGWIVKHDSLGNMQWELTLGSEAIYEWICSIEQASDGGYYVCMQNESAGEGNVLCLPTEGSNATLVKLSQFGEIEWQECYGCKYTSPGSWEQSAIVSVIELDDGGFLFAGDAACNSGDLTGSGWHYGTLNNIPNSEYTTDIWLWRVDANRNIVWSKCYGGSGFDFLSKIFQTDDKGFIVFGTTHSNNGDVASASHIDLQCPNTGAAWIFRTDANGNLLWERCLGYGQLGRTSIADVIRHNDREYTLVGNMVCPSTNGIAGDINCSNCRYLYNQATTPNSNNYWVAHITDTVDYTTLQVPERPMQEEEAEVEVYPSPANKTVCVVLPHEAYATELELFNMKGQKVAHKVFSGKSSWLEMEELPPGVYILKIHNAECCVTRKVLKD